MLVVGAQAYGIACILGAATASSVCVMLQNRRHWVGSIHFTLRSNKWERWYYITHQVIQRISALHHLSDYIVSTVCYFFICYSRLGINELGVSIQLQLYVSLRA